VQPPSLPPSPIDHVFIDSCTKVYGEGDCSEVDFCRGGKTVGFAGDCVFGLCHCHDGFAGVDCSVAVTCEFWDDSIPGWNTEGCSASAPPGGLPDGFLHCNCTHLTDFGGIQLPTSGEALLDMFASRSFNTFSAEDMAAFFTTFDPAANAVILSIVTVITFLNLFTLWFARFRFHRRVLAVTRRARRERREKLKTAQAKLFAKRTSSSENAQPASKPEPKLEPEPDPQPSPQPDATPRSDTAERVSRGSCAVMCAAAAKHPSVHSTAVAADASTSLPPESPPRPSSSTEPRAGDATPWKSCDSRLRLQWADTVTPKPARSLAAPSAKTLAVTLGAVAKFKSKAAEAAKGDASEGKDCTQPAGPASIKAAVAKLKAAKEPTAGPTKTPFLAATATARLKAKAAEAEAAHVKRQRMTKDARKVPFVAAAAEAKLKAKATEVTKTKDPAAAPQSASAEQGNGAGDSPEAASKVSRWTRFVQPRCAPSVKASTEAGDAPESWSHAVSASMRARTIMESYSQRAAELRREREAAGEPPECAMNGLQERLHLPQSAPTQHTAHVCSTLRDVRLPLPGFLAATASTSQPRLGFSRQTSLATAAGLAAAAEPWLQRTASSDATAANADSAGADATLATDSPSDSTNPALDRPADPTSRPGSRLGSASVRRRVGSTAGSDAFLLRSSEVLRPPQWTGERQQPSPPPSPPIEPTNGASSSDEPDESHLVPMPPVG